MDHPLERSPAGLSEKTPENQENADHSDKDGAKAKELSPEVCQNTGVLCLKGIEFFLGNQPGVMAWPLLFQLLLVILAVGLPWLLMTLVARSPARRLYPYLFG